MTRAYIRLDPQFDERKEAYPDGPYRALVACLCLSESQPVRGRFRSMDYLRRLLGKAMVCKISTHDQHIGMVRHVGQQCLDTSL